MAKSNRRRKLDRAKRQVRETQKQTVGRRRQEWQQYVADAVDRAKRLADPDSPLLETAEVLHEAHNGGPVPVFVVSRLQEVGWSLERLAELADVMLAPNKTGETGETGETDKHEPSLTDLTFAVQVAHAAGDRARASELMNRALAATEDGSPSQLGLTNQLRGIGRLAEAIELLEASLRDDPADDHATERYGSAISEACEQANGPRPANGCTCGSGAAWDGCCGPRERAVLDRFADRSGLTDLMDAMGAFAAGSNYGPAIGNEVATYLTAVEEVKFKAEDLDSFRALVTEYAMLTVPPEPQDGQDEAEARTAFEAFAADPAVPAELAARAKAVRDHLRYGLWKVESEPPGVWCTDICTGGLRYANFPAQFTDGWPRWSVWLGAIIPVDGIWRATGTGLRLSPAEADAAAEFVQTAVLDVVNSLSGKKRSSRSADDRMRIGAAEPNGVLIEQLDPMSPLVGSVTSMALANLMWRVFLEVQLHRRTKHLMGRALTGEGWEKDWIDEPQAALRGRTPRQAAAGKERPRLEALLRQFEYEADELAALGQSGIDTDWLRQELDLEVLSPDD